MRRPRHLRAQEGCRPLRGVFYAATDWLRLATKLAATPSPCAQYYVSIPPIVGDKTNLRPGQAERIRALGANFHALAEFHWTTWSRWVADNATTWFAAGVEMRRRMAQAGFDIAAGDTWAVNEFPSTVRSGAGDARANARELVRGLYEGDGTRTARGAVFIVGLGQPTTNVSVYQTNLQNWLADTAFWTDMSTFVSDWSQEVYGDFRRYAVPGAPITLRRDYLNEYLQHALVVARAGPPTIELARGFLQTAFSPVANAAWQYESGYGWTLIPVDQMRAFVSAQVYALRSFSVAAGLPQDHWGFAWQPRNGSGLSAGDFAAQTGSILDRLGVAIRDSGPTDPNDPGGGACGPPGQNVFCGGDFTGGLFTESWKAFRAWFGSVLAFATPSQALTAGQPSAPVSLGLQTSTGGPVATTTPITVTLTSSAQEGRFSLSPSGPWATQISVTIPTGGTATPPFHYLDTRAGRPQIRATALGVTTGNAGGDGGAGASFDVDRRPALGSNRPSRVSAIRSDRRRRVREPTHGPRSVVDQAGRPRGREPEDERVDDRQSRRARRKWPRDRASRRGLCQREPEGEPGHDSRVIDPLFRPTHGRARDGERRGGRRRTGAWRSRIRRRPTKRPCPLHGEQADRRDGPHDVPRTPRRGLLHHEGDERDGSRLQVERSDAAQPVLHIAECLGRGMTPCSMAPMLRPETVEAGRWDSMLRRMYAQLAREQGQTMAEYAIVLTVITVGTLAVFGALSGGIQSAISNVAGVL